LSEYIETFRSRVNEQKAREAFPEITATENLVWIGSPHVLSMLSHYVLALLIILLHLLFYWATEGSPIVGESRLSHLFSKTKYILDFLGVFGFAIVVFTVAKINHYLNFSTSSKWTTAWLILNGLVPLTMVLAGISGEILSAFSDNVIEVPEWLHLYYLLLGLISGGLLFIFTFIYRRSFKYAITDRRIHISKKFLYFDTSTHGMTFNKIENIKVEPPLIGRIFGFGNVHVVTASGLGLREDESGIGGGLASEVDPTSSDRRGLSRFIFGWIKAQRQRKTVDQNPADCLFGVRKPNKLYRLINELIDS